MAGPVPFGNQKRHREAPDFQDPWNLLTGGACRNVHVHQGSKGKATLFAQKFANNRYSIQLHVFVLSGPKRVSDPPNQFKPILIIAPKEV